MRPILYILLLISIISGCHNATRYEPSKNTAFEPQNNYSLSYLAGDTLSIDVGFFDNYVDYQSIEIDSVAYYVGLNTRDVSLDFIPLTDQGNLRKIAFDSEGPDGIVGSIDGFFYHNRDTIFILSIDANTIYLMNEGSRLIDKFSFIDVPLPDGFDNYDAYADEGLKNGPFYSPVNKTIHFYTYRWLPESKDDYSYYAFASYSIEYRKFTSIYGHYPENYIKGANFILYNDPALLVIDTLSFTLLGASPNIYKYNNISGELLAVSQEHCEHWKDNPVPFTSSINDFQKEVEWLISEPAYVSIIHDKKENLIFRFLKHRQPAMDTGGLKNSRWMGPWCISIYTYDLLRVGHSELPKNSVLPVNSFISDGVLWIKNPSPEVQEDQSLFYKFEVKTIEND